MALCNDKRSLIRDKQPFLGLQLPKAECLPVVEYNRAPPISKTAKSVVPLATDIPAMIALRRTWPLSFFSSIKGSPLIDSTGVELLICAKLCLRREPILLEKLMGRIVKLAGSLFGSVTVEVLGKITQALGPSETREARPKGTD